jgi:hypothetical protein
MHFIRWLVPCSLRKGEACVPHSHSYQATDSSFFSRAPPPLCLERSQTLPKESPYCLSKMRYYGKNSPQHSCLFRNTANWTFTSSAFSSDFCNTTNENASKLTCSRFFFTALCLSQFRQEILMSYSMLFKCPSALPWRTLLRIFLVP